MRIGNPVIVLGVALMVFCALFPGYYSARAPGTIFRAEDGRQNVLLFLYVLLIASAFALISIGVKLRQTQTIA